MLSYLSNYRVYSHALSSLIMKFVPNRLHLYVQLETAVLQHRQFQHQLPGQRTETETQQQLLCSWWKFLDQENVSSTLHFNILPFSINTPSIVISIMPTGFCL